MSSELYLVAHKVHDQPAFDVASRMECAVCHDNSTERTECTECDGTGFWWIIPTSGHRAYPYAWQPWHAMDIGPGFDVPMPPALPDHYASRASPSAPSGLAALLAKRKPMNIERRGR